MDVRFPTEIADVILAHIDFLDGLLEILNRW